MSVCMVHRTDCLCVLCMCGVWEQVVSVRTSVVKGHALQVTGVPTALDGHLGRAERGVLSACPRVQEGKDPHSLTCSSV